MPKQTDTPPATKEQPPTDGQQQSRQASVQTPPVKPSPPPTSPQENSAIQEEPPRPAQPPQIALSKSAAFAPDLILAAPKSDQPAIRPLKIPGQKPDTVAFDQKNGALRQVYYQGTMQEITITQRL
ncbi:hypothetical protein [Sporomusa carbonis]|uniref:hypothetical protein n=1 Tax=Sporomusa carbonis TaxID=3076075 RepID=UPI003C7CCC1D